MKRKLLRPLLLSLLMLTAGLTFSNNVSANCLDCPGVTNDGWCYSQECQLVIMEGFECNRYGSQKGKCPIIVQ